MIMKKPWKVTNYLHTWYHSRFSDMDNHDNMVVSYKLYIFKASILEHMYCSPLTCADNVRVKYMLSNR